MLYGAKLIVQTLLGKDQVGRNFGVYPDDTFIISYPKSGSTWTRFLVANLAHPEETVTFANLDRVLPATAVASRRQLKKMSRPRILKSHNYFDHRYKRVVYVVRDPRDVVLSEYRFNLKGRAIQDGYPIEKFVTRFVNGEIGDYGSWKENVASWVATRCGSSNFLLLRYEDMVADTAREVAKVAAFLGIHASPERIASVVEKSSADKMRAMEKKESETWVVTKGRRKDIPFVGAATAGGWKSKLPQESIEEIEAAWGNLMTQLGYELVTRKAVNAETQLAGAITPGDR